MTLSVCTRERERGEGGVRGLTNGCCLIWADNLGLCNFAMNLSKEIVCVWESVLIYAKVWKIRQPIAIINSMVRLFLWWTPQKFDIITKMLTTWQFCNKNLESNSHVKLTKPTKKRTATAPDRTAAYCIHVLRTAILRLKLLAVEKTPMKSSNRFSGRRGTDLSASKSIIWSKSSDVGKPLAKTDIKFRSPDILTSLTSHGSKLWTDKQTRKKIKTNKLEPVL